MPRGTGLVSPGGMQHLLEGVMIFWFLPKVLGGFGLPRVAQGVDIPACHGEGSREGKPKEHRLQ